MKTLFNTYKFDITLLLVRVTLGVVIFGHGAQKLFGWFGGYGFSGTMNYFTESVGLPYSIGLLVILGESLGMIALLIGLFSRFMSASLFVIIVGAIYIGHIEHGFFMNWFGNQAGEGYEFHLLVLASSLVIVINGGGAFSIDQWWVATKGNRTHAIPTTAPRG